jgi:hypothetical protein
MWWLQGAKETSVVALLRRPRRWRSPPLRRPPLARDITDAPRRPHARLFLFLSPIASIDHLHFHTRDDIAVREREHRDNSRRRRKGERGCSERAVKIKRRARARRAAY